MAETAFAGPWAGSTRRRGSASGDAVRGRLWRVGPIDTWENARCEQRWASGDGAVARFGGCMRLDVSLRLVARQCTARFGAWRTWRRPSVSARERAPRKLVSVVLAPAVNLRLDDNAALVAGLQHAALGDADLVVAAPRSLARTYAAAYGDVDAALRRRGSALWWVDERGLVGASGQPVLPDWIFACRGAEALLQGFPAQRLVWCQSTPAGTAPREAPRLLPPLPPGWSPAQVHPPSVPRRSVNSVSVTETRALAQLHSLACHLELPELVLCLREAVAAGVLSEARLVHECRRRHRRRRHQQQRALRRPRRLPHIAVLALACAGAPSLALRSAHGTEAHAVFDVRGSHVRELIWDDTRHRYVYRHRAGDANYEAEMRGFFQRRWLWLKQSFIPEDVSPDYYAFAQWRVFQRLMSSTIGVFGTQALLLALGIKSGNKISQAATISWVLKDGLSRIGKMLWASQLGRDMDADPKRFRFFSALLYSLGNGLEILTRVLPQSFLLIATAANTAKLCSMLTASATRNAMYRSFSGRHDNIADITAKGEAQITIADLGGMALGIQLSKVIGTSRPKVALTYLVLSAVDLFAIWQELRVIEFRTLNLQRSCLIVEQYLRHGTVPTPKEVSARERILLPEPLPRSAFTSLDRLIRSQTEAEALFRRYEGEKFILRPGPVQGLWRWFRPDHGGIVLRDDATPQDVFRAIVAWNILRHKLVDDEEQVVPRMRQTVDAALAAAAKAGWQNLVYPRFSRRAHW